MSWSARVAVAVLLWLGTGGVLKHTDDLSAFVSFPMSSHQAPAIHQGVAAAPAGDDDCAACRWEATTSTIAVLLPIIPAADTTHIDRPVAIAAFVRNRPNLHAHTFALLHTPQLK